MESLKQMCADIEFCQFTSVDCHKLAVEWEGEGREEEGNEYL